MDPSIRPKPILKGHHDQSDGQLQSPSPIQYMGQGVSSSANPDEDWTKLSDVAERRRIQNRISQRNYREKLKTRLDNLERHAGSSGEGDAEKRNTRNPDNSGPLMNLTAAQNFHSQNSGQLDSFDKPVTTSNVAPGSVATTPRVAGQDGNNVQWLAFEYSRGRVKMEYTIRCDVESVVIEDLTPDFKQENCVYPRACGPNNQYPRNRLMYEMGCNRVGWALAQLNFPLRGNRGLIKRAVYSWRQRKQDPRLRDRRARRMDNGKIASTGPSLQSINSKPASIEEVDTNSTSTNKIHPSGIPKRLEHQYDAASPAERDRDVALLHKSHLQSAGVELPVRKTTSCDGVPTWAFNTEPLKGLFGGSTNPTMLDMPQENLNNLQDDTQASKLPNSDDLPRSLPGDELHDQASLKAESSNTSTVFTGTDSDSATEDEEILTQLGQKRALLGRLMDFFHCVFSACPSPNLGVRTHVSGRTGHSLSPGKCEQQSSKDPSLPLRHIQHSLQKRKGDEEEENGRNKRPCPPTAGDEARVSSQRLACPFFKRNPNKYQSRRTCPGPGWTSVHRVKEHVYRNHSLPIACPRCQENFETDKEKDEHIRAERRCEPQPGEAAEGIDATQKERLRSRKKKSKEYTEYEKWNDMYLIIFPEDDPACIPSPYYDYMTPQNPDLNGFPSAFSQYEQFLRQELPSRVRQELEVRIRERLNPIEEGLRGELVDIVRDMQLQLFNIYRASRATPNTTDNAIVSPENGNAVISGAASGETDQIWDTAEQLQPFSQPPHLDDLQFDAFNGLVFDFSVPDMDCYSFDSGIGIMTSTEKDN